MNKMRIRRTLITLSCSAWPLQLARCPPAHIAIRSLTRSRTIASALTSERSWLIFRELPDGVSPARAAEEIKKQPAARSAASMRQSVVLFWVLMFRKILLFIRARLRSDHRALHGRAGKLLESCRSRSPQKSQSSQREAELFFSVISVRFVVDLFFAAHEEIDGSCYRGVLEEVEVGAFQKVSLRLAQTLLIMRAPPEI
jgi:hypothetical protein